MSERIHPSVAARLAPIWLEQELEYANAKYGNKNPQLPALTGGLHEGGLAYEDFSKYFWKASFFFDNAEGNEFVLLKGVQNVGKFLGVGRALCRVLLEQQGYDIARADQITIGWLGSNLVANSTLPLGGRDLRRYWNETYEPGIARVAQAISQANWYEVADGVSDLVLEQGQFFVDAICSTGVIPRPGLSSTDEHNELDHWYA